MGQPAEELPGISVVDRVPLGPFDQEFNEALELPTGYPLPPFSEEFDEAVAARLKAMSKDQPPVPAEEEKK